MIKIFLLLLIIFNINIVSGVIIDDNNLSEGSLIYNSETIEYEYILNSSDNIENIRFKIDVNKYPSDIYINFYDLNGAKMQFYLNSNVKSGLIRSKQINTFMLSFNEVFLTGYAKQYISGFPDSDLRNFEQDNLNHEILLNSLERTYLFNDEIEIFINFYGDSNLYNDRSIMITGLDFTNQRLFYYFNDIGFTPNRLEIINTDNNNLLSDISIEYIDTINANKYKNSILYTCANNLNPIISIIYDILSAGLFVLDLFMNDNTVKDFKTSICLPMSYISILISSILSFISFVFTIGLLLFTVTIELLIFIFAMIRNKNIYKAFDMWYIQSKEFITYFYIKPTLFIYNVVMSIIKLIRS